MVVTVVKPEGFHELQHMTDERGRRKATLLSSLWYTETDCDALLLLGADFDEQLLPTIKIVNKQKKIENTKEGRTFW